MMKKYKLVNILIVFIAMVAITFGVYFYLKLNKIENNSDVAIKKKVETLLSQVSEIYLFPENEEPTVATVSDPQALSDKSFFTLALKGDKVLIFTKSGKAILYRPNINKIIDIVSVKQEETTKNNNIIPNEN